VAGNGKARFSGDGGPAVKASLHTPTGLAVDRGGNLLIADQENNRVRRLSPSGIITTLVGSGPVGFNHVSAAGDGGPAVKAHLSGPWGLALSATGDLFIGDENNGRLCKVDREGIITTVVELGQRDSYYVRTRGVAIDGDGNIYFVETGASHVRKRTPGGTLTTVAGLGSEDAASDGGPAAKAGLKTAQGVAVDAQGNLFICELWRNRIRKVDRHGIITTVAGDGEAGDPDEGSPATKTHVSRPMGIAVDSAGDLFIAADSRILKVTLTGILTTVAGTSLMGYSGDGGPATKATLNYPLGVAIDAVGNLFIADSINNRVRKVLGAAAPGLLAGKAFP
jgi:sugar lactone lactonase YvrE